MQYCRNCVLPDTRPNLVLDDAGVCNACASHGTKKDVDWAAREKLFRSVVGAAKSQSKGYDCLIPVSGGKDSTWQVVKCLEYGLNPLAVTWKTPARTELGQQNLDNLVRIGVDHIDYQVNPEVEKRFMYRALVKYGSTAIPMHMALFNIPLNLAVRLDIPLVVWGENSAFEYGGTEEEARGFKLDATWLKTFGVTHGTTAADWVSEGLSEKELTPYFGPTDEALGAAGMLAVFLGYYFSWSAENSLSVAKAHGFRERAEGPKTGLWNYADIDDDFISIHHYLKWYKFGFTRLFDNLSQEIRNGNMTRNDAVEVIRGMGDPAPRDDIGKLCEFLSISEDHFFEVIEAFRNADVWTNEGGVWRINDFVVSDRRWS